MDETSAVSGEGDGGILPPSPALHINNSNSNSNGDVDGNNGSNSDKSDHRDVMPPAPPQSGSGNHKYVSVDQIHVQSHILGSSSSININTASSNDEILAFQQPDEGTPAFEALAANASLKVSKLEKGLHKLRGINKIGPKMKSLNFIRQIKKHTKNKRDKNHMSRNFKGKVIGGLHELYTLTAGIMLGIRNVVGRTGINEKPNLSISDFNYVEKLVFPAKGNTVPPFITPPHGLVHTFKFKSYAPKVFKRLRDFYNIDPSSYMMSVCGNYNYLEFISNSKSGQFFFYTHDGKYMIKTQTKEENKFMRHILPHYFKYLTENPHSTFCRVLGMHRVKMYHLRRKVHFVIMASVFDSPVEIHTIYDLKGSTIGRLTKEEHAEKGSILKDLNLLKSNTKFHLGPKKASFMEQIAKDAYFLASLNIMDYSLLVGVHDRERRGASIVSMLDISTGDETNSKSLDDHSVPANEPQQPSGDHNLKQDHRNQPDLVPFNVSTSSAAGGGSGVDHPSSNPPVASPGQKERVRSTHSLTPFRNRQYIELGASNSNSNFSGRPNSLALSGDMSVVLDVQYDNNNSNSRNNSNISGNMNRNSNYNNDSIQRNGVDEDENATWNTNEGYKEAHLDDGDSDVESEICKDIPSEKPDNISVATSKMADSNSNNKSNNDENNNNNNHHFKCAKNRSSSAGSGSRSHSTLISVKAGDQDSMQPTDATSPVVADGTGASGFEGADLSNIFVSEEVLVQSVAEMRRSITQEFAGVEFEGFDRTDNVAGGGENAKRSDTPTMNGHVPDIVDMTRRGESPPPVIQTSITYGKGHTSTHPWTTRKDLGINSRNSRGNTRGREIYYMGIIDILQEYNWRKRSENFFKGLVQDRREISAVDAQTYARRFIQFLDDAID